MLSLILNLTVRLFDCSNNKLISKVNNNYLILKILMVRELTCFLIVSSLLDWPVRLYIIIYNIQS
jgi:hypothetical protein